MKVLLINHFPLTGSGSGVYTTNIAKSLIAKGHEVCVIMPEITKNYEKIPGLKMHPVYFKAKEQIEGQLPFNFPCFTTHPYSTNNFNQLTYEEEMMYRSAFTEALEEEIASFQPDIIHGQHIWILSNLATQYDVPVVITAHGTDLLGHQASTRFHADTNHAVDACKEIITISKDNTDLVLSTFPNAKGKVSWIKNGYDAIVFYPQDYDKNAVLHEFGIEKEYDHVVSFAGKLTHIKGVDTLLQAAKEYEDSNTLTLIAGNGELYDELVQLSKDLQLKDVKFLGNVNHETLRKIYNIADVSVVPSRSEAFGLVAIEALACGTPVIATNQGGLPGIITDDFGKLFEVGDAKRLSELIQNVLSNKEQYIKTFIETEIKKQYAQESLVDELIGVYEKALEKRKIR